MVGWMGIGLMMVNISVDSEHVECPLFFPLQSLFCMKLVVSLDGNPSAAASAGRRLHMSVVRFCVNLYILVYALIQSPLSVSVRTPTPPV
jgi:hypothetical protein